MERVYFLLAFGVGMVASYYAWSRWAKRDAATKKRLTPKKTPNWGGGGTGGDDDTHDDVEAFSMFNRDYVPMRFASFAPPAKKRTAKKTPTKTLVKPTPKKKAPAKKPVVKKSVVTALPAPKRAPRSRDI